MLRFLSFLFNKPYETCKSCETLKEQLIYERAEKMRLTDTLLNIIKPKEFEAPPVEVNSIQQTSALFSKRRKALEEQDRLSARTRVESKNLGMPDNIKNIEDLEKELDIPDEVVRFGSS